MSESSDEFDAGEEALAAAEDVIEAGAQELENPTPEQYAQLAAERDQYLDRLQRLHADFDNFRKRAAREKGDVSSFAVGRFAEELLPVLDACEAAAAHGSDEVEPITKALHGVMFGQGLKILGEVGEAFDPNIHDAVMHEPGDGPQVVAEVLRPGYAWGDRVLRPAMVKVSG
ncbi:MAG: nucleotide exchange factor GrpE [Acidimicrobiales bacterium]